LIVATGNITGGNLTTAGRLSVTSNANVGNIGATAGVFTGAITGSTTLSVTGNANVGNLGTSGLIVATGNITGGNLTTGGALSVTGNVTLGTSGILRTVNSLLSVDATITPYANTTYDLGSATKRWDSIYANTTVYLGNATIVASDTTITMSNAFVATGITSTGNLSVSGKTSLGSISNVSIAGGSSGLVLSTDGLGNLSWSTPTTAAGTNTQIQFNDSGSFAGNAGFTFNKTTGTLSATLLTGTLTTNAQPNITSIGTVSILNASGNITGGNIKSNGLANISGTANVGNLVTSGIINSTGTITGGNLYTAGDATALGSISAGSISTSGALTATGNINGGNLTTGGNVVATGNISANNLTTTKDLTIGGNITSANITGSGYANVSGNIVSGGFIFANSGNIQGNNITVTRTLTTANVSATTSISTVDLSSNGNVNFTGANVSLGSISNLHITGGSSGYFLSTNGTGTLSWASPSGAQGSNQQVQFNNAGSLAGSSSFTFNKDTGVLNATQFNGSGAGLTNMPAANISGTVANANYAAYAGNVTIAAQSNITTLGTLGNLFVTDDSNLGNLNVSKLTNLGPVANVKITGGNDGYILKTDGTGNLSWITAPDTRPAGSTTEVQFNDGSVFGSNSAFTFTKATGKLKATIFEGAGNNLSNIQAANLTGTIPVTVSFSGTVANATQANVANYATNVTGNTQSNITAVGTLKRLRVSNAGYNEVDSFAIVGTSQAGYFSTTDTSFWITSAPNSINPDRSTGPANVGSGFEIAHDINQITFLNGGYQTIFTNPHGDLKPKTSSAGGSLTGSLGGKAQGVDYVYGITGTPNVAIAFASDYYNLSQDYTSGSGTGAVFEIFTVPAIGGNVYSVLVTNPGHGYLEGDTVRINGTQLGGNRTHDCTFTVSQTWDAYWRNLYVGDVNLNNGTGDWTLMAGSDGLYLRNNGNGSKYKITMTSVPSGGPSPLGE